MTIAQLILRSLRYYWRTNIVVVFGLAVAASVIIGSLIIGDSIKGSLLDSATSRLGNIDYALSTPTMFSAALSGDIINDASLKPKLHAVSSAMILRGSAESGTTDTILPKVNVVGIDESFARFYPTQPFIRLSGRHIAVNASLARELDVKVGDSVIVNLDKQMVVPSGTLFAHRSLRDTQATLRLVVAKVLDDTGVGGFRLDVGTDIPPNVFVSSDWLSSAIGKPNRANTILVQKDSNSDIDITQFLQSSLGKNCVLADYGLTSVDVPAQNSISLQSDALLLSPTQLRAAQEASVECGGMQTLSSIYLASEIRNLSKHGVSSAYAIIAGVQPTSSFSFTSVRSNSPGKDGIWLNNWIARDINARVGDKLELTYLVPQPDGSYHTSKVLLTLTGIVDITGPADDRSLVPHFDGISGTERIEDWNTPFPVDLHRVTERDDEYWRIYGTTPKAFMDISAVRSMWQNGDAKNEPGWVTSVRVSPRSNMNIDSLRSKYEKLLLQHLFPSGMGMVFRPVRQQAIQSAQGNTDFSQLFLAMSFFIILAGVALASTLLKLSIERRASEMGILLVSGFKTSDTLRALLGEGLFLSCSGALLGLPFGIGYAYAVISALRLWWVSAVGTSFLSTHVLAPTLAIGVISSFIVGLSAISWAVLRLRMVQVLQLIGGWQYMSAIMQKHPGRRSAVILATCVVTVVLLLVMAAITGKGSGEALLFGVGTVLLISSLAFADLVLVRIHARKSHLYSIGGLALRSMAANRSRSLLVIGLLAAAAFTIITIAASTRDFSRMDYTKKDSGTGGFALRAIMSSAVHYDLNSKAGRAALGFTADDEEILRDVQVFPFLTTDGDDISCLNPAKAASPRVLGVSDLMIQRGGFNVNTSIHDKIPWTQLQKTDGVIPVFGDTNTVLWNLHSDLGRNYPIYGTNGKSFITRFAGLIPQSIFASELLVSESQFKRMFPGVDGPRYFLIDVPPGYEQKVTSVFRRNLGQLGIEVRGTREILNAYMGVQNTYLSMFLALGGLGMILGTVGLVIILLRSALERRSEFAVMLSQGFKRSDIMKLLLIENTWLLFAGLVLGTISALTAVTPALTGMESQINWSAIAILFMSISTTGVISCILAARSAANGVLLDALRGEQ